MQEILCSPVLKVISGCSIEALLIYSAIFVIFEALSQVCEE
jgi:hypothetical protein